MGYQSALLAARRLSGVAADERRGQCLLEEHQSVDMTGKGVSLIDEGIAFLLPYHVAQHEARAKHTAK